MSIPAFLFVYGTLREDVAHPMGSILRRHAKPVGAASYKGQLFDLGEYPGAIPSQDGADRVVGELYRIEPEREALLFEALDRYEDCDPDNPSAGEYVRARAKVEPEAGGPVEAWIYLYNRSTTHLDRIVSGDYAGHRRGARKRI